MNRTAPGFPALTDIAAASHSPAATWRSNIKVIADNLCARVPAMDRFTAEEFALAWMVVNVG